jgi:hypothetical protein
MYFTRILSHLPERALMLVEDFAARVALVSFAITDNPADRLTSVLTVSYTNCCGVDVVMYKRTGYARQIELWGRDGIAMPYGRGSATMERLVCSLERLAYSDEIEHARWCRRFRVPNVDERRAAKIEVAHRSISYTPRSTAPCPPTSAPSCSRSR